MTSSTPPIAELPEQARIRTSVKIVVLVGVALRLRQYLARTSFSDPESYVVLNVIDHSWKALLNQLEHGQAAPPLFLWLERAAALTFGTSEYSMRLLPLLCGIAALVLFAVVGWRLFSPGVALCLVIVVAFCGKLIEFSVDTKQYSGDVMVCTLLLLLATAPGRGAMWRLGWCAVVATVAVWFSHTAAIVFGSISLLLTSRCLRQGPREAVKAIGWNSLFLVSFLILYFVSIRYESTQWMHEGWIEDFPDLRHPARIPSWLAVRGFQLLGAAFPMVGPFLAITCLVGIAGLLAEGFVELSLVLFLPIVLIAMASVAQRYPFGSSRLSLFVLPQIFLMFGAGLEVARRKMRGGLAKAWWVFALPVLSIAVVTATIVFISPPYRSHIRPVVGYVRAHRQPGEAIYLTGLTGRIDPDPTIGRHIEFLCYWRCPPPPVRSLAPVSWAAVPERRFWVVLPFQPGRNHRWMDDLLADIRRNATQIDQFVDPHGGAAYLFVH